MPSAVLAVSPFVRKLMHLDTLRWDPWLCELFGVPLGVLPRIVPSTGEVARTHGFEPLRVVVPDVHVRQASGGGWTIELNEAVLPRLAERGLVQRRSRMVHREDVQTGVGPTQPSVGGSDPSAGKVPLERVAPERDDPGQGQASGGCGARCGHKFP